MEEIFSSELRRNSCIDKEQVVEVVSPTWIQYNYIEGCGHSSSVYDILESDNIKLYRGQTSLNNITFRLLTKTMVFSAYGLESTETSKQTCFWSYPKTWKLYGSNDLSTWVEIDSKINDLTLKTKSVLHKFYLKRKYLI